MPVLRHTILVLLHIAPFMCSFEDSEGQLHIIFLVNDILFERYFLNFSYGYLAIAGIK